MDINVTLGGASNDLNVNFSETSSALNVSMSSNPIPDITLDEVSTIIEVGFSESSSTLDVDMGSCYPTVTSPNRAIISNNQGALIASDITSTELGYLDGVRSNIQEQLDNGGSGGIHTHGVNITSNGPSVTISALGSVNSPGQSPILGQSINADEILNWNAGSLPTLGQSIHADKITNWSAGTLPVLTIAPVQVSTGSDIYMANFQFSQGTLPLITVEEKEIPNILSVGTLPSLGFSKKTIPNITDVGYMPTFNSIQVASGSHTHVVNGNTASNQN